MVTIAEIDLQTQIQIGERCYKAEDIFKALFDIRGIPYEIIEDYIPPTE